MTGYALKLKVSVSTGFAERIGVKLKHGGRLCCGGFSEKDAGDVSSLFGGVGWLAKGTLTA